MREEIPSFLYDGICRMDLKLTMAAFSDPVGESWNFHHIRPQRNALYYIKKGTGRIVMEDTHTAYSPKPGQLMLLPYGRTHSISVVRGEPTYTKYWCCFTAALGYGDFFEKLSLPLCLDVPDPQKLDWLFQEMIQKDASRKLEDRLGAQADLFQILQIYFSLCQGQIALKQEPGTFAVDRVLEYMQEHLSQNITVEELAEVVHLHPSHFIRLFKDKTGFPPLHYLNQRRMETAKKFLLYSEQPIGEIAGQVGMEPHYFSRMFKRHIGMSPALFRQTVRRELAQVEGRREEKKTEKGEWEHETL